MTILKNIKKIITVGVLLLIFASLAQTSNTAFAQDIVMSERITPEQLVLKLEVLEKTNIAYLSQTGWIESVTVRVNPFADPMKGTPYEGLTSDYMIEDSWIYVEDADGKLGKASFVMMRDKAGNVLQISAANDSGEGGNLTLMRRGLLPDSSESAPDMDVITLKSQVSQFLADLVRNKADIAKIQVDENDQRVIVEIQYRMDALDFEQFAEPVIAFSQKTTFDKATGNILEGRTNAVLASGKTELWSSYQNLKNEPAVSMPADTAEAMLAALEEIRQLRLSNE